MKETEPPPGTPRYTFEVRSPRWAEPDTYTLYRTINGWYVSHLAINGNCDPSGRPKLFDNLEHDAITYPSTLADQLLELWSEANNGDLSED